MRYAPISLDDIQVGDVVCLQEVTITDDGRCYDSAALAKALKENPGRHYWPLADVSTMTVGIDLGDFVARRLKIQLGKVFREIPDRLLERRAKIDLVPQPDLPESKYRLIVADPPWQYSLREADRTHRNRLKYPPMSIENIKALPVKELAEKDAYLLLWTTKNHMEQAYSVARSWGFEPKTFHTWLKVTKDGKPRIGVGHYGRITEEHFLVCTRGKPGSWTALGLTDVPTTLIAPRPPKHSKKPSEFWPIANRLKDGLETKHGNCKSLELFARDSQLDWDCWGKEAPAMRKDSMDLIAS